MSHRGSSKRNGTLPREVQVSKKLSWLLRHGAEKEGLKIGQGGYINMTAVLANRNLRSLKVSFEEVQQIVRENDKQRFSLIPDPDKYPIDTSKDPSQIQDAPTTSTDPADWAIRANQGHSIKLESDAGLLTPITKDNLPDVAVHGTTHANWPRIVTSSGLKPMGRNHIHFASGLPAGFKSLADTVEGAVVGAPVISGMRSSSTILIYLDLSKALDTGLHFGLSQNGVILSEGNADGLIPIELFKRVEDRSGEGVLVQDGQIIKEAPTHWSKKSKSGS